MSVETARVRGETGPSVARDLMPPTVAKQEDLEKRVQTGLNLSQQIHNACAVFFLRLDQTLASEDPVKKECSALNLRITKNPLETEGEKLHAAISLSWLLLQRLQSHSDERVVIGGKREIEKLLPPLLPRGVRVLSFHKEVSDILEEMLHADLTRKTFAAFQGAAVEEIEQTAQAESERLQKEERATVDIREMAHDLLLNVVSEVYLARDISQQRIQMAREGLLKKLQLAGQEAQEIDRIYRENLHLLQKLSKETL